MPRGSRIDYPGAFHHVFARGIEKRDIFVDADDRRELRRRIILNVGRFQSACPVWSFMANHFHLLYFSAGGNLPDFMRCLMTGYSLYFNRRHERVGHLFQNRYKSTVIDSERYLLELVRYIHLNPVRSGEVSSLAELSRYEWTGHGKIVRTRGAPWKDLPMLGDFFSRGGGEFAIKEYLAFMQEGLDAGSVSEWPVAEDPGPAEGACPTGIRCDQGGADFRFFRSEVAKAARNVGLGSDLILSGCRRRLCAEARRRILDACVFEGNISRAVVCSWLGITDAGGAYLMRKGSVGR